MSLTLVYPTLSILDLKFLLPELFGNLHTRKTLLSLLKTDCQWIESRLGYTGDKWFWR